MSATSLKLRACGPVNMYCALAWAPGCSSVSAATAAMSSASTNASVPPPLGAVITPSMTGR